MNVVSPLPSLSICLRLSKQPVVVLSDDIGKYASLGLKVAITEADARTFVDGPTTQVPTNGLENFAQPFEMDEMLKASLAHPELISFTVWGFTDADSWVPGFFTRAPMAIVTSGPRRKRM